LTVDLTHNLLILSNAEFTQYFLAICSQSTGWAAPPAIVKIDERVNALCLAQQHGIVGDGIPSMKK
jgi:hypothetical protein